MTSQSGSGTKRKPEIDMFTDTTPTKVQVVEATPKDSAQLPPELLSEVQLFEQEIKAISSGTATSNKLNHQSSKPIIKTIVRKPITKTISAPPTYNRDIAADDKKSGLSSPLGSMAGHSTSLTQTSFYYNPPSAALSAPSKKDDNEKRSKPKRYIRKAAGQNWEDPTLAEWPEDDFRIFCGDLGNEVTDEMLANAFSKYNSFVKAKVIRDKRTGKTKGYGFVSFSDPMEFIKALNEMNGKYIGNRPVKLRKSKWEERNDLTAIKKESSSGKKEKKKKKKEKENTS